MTCRELLSVTDAYLDGELSTFESFAFMIISSTASIVGRCWNRRRRCIRC
jgi:hypothetical protein